MNQMMNKKYIWAYIIIASIYVLFNGWLSGISSMLQMLLRSIILVAFLLSPYFFYTTLFPWKWGVKKFISLAIPVYFLGLFLELFLFILLIGVSYYYNVQSPATMSRITLSNSEKTLIFQEMSHIGTENFYICAWSGISLLSNSGFQIYYEGVGSGTVENMKTFQKMLWIEFTDTLYESFAQSIWMQSQKYESFISSEILRTAKNVDIWIDSIVTIANSKYGSGFYKESTPLSIEANIIEWISQMTENEKRVYAYFIRGLLNMMANSYQDISVFWMNSEIIDIILHERNKVISQRIQTSSDKKIIAFYGALHFNWIFEELKKQDIRWKVVHIDNCYPY
jgi:hypothetical protein